MPNTTNTFKIYLGNADKMSQLPYCRKYSSHAIICLYDNKKKNPVGRPPGKKVKEAPKGQCKIDSFIEMDLC